MGKMLLGLAAAAAAMAGAAPAVAGTPEEPFVAIPNVNGAVGTFNGAINVHPGFGGHGNSFGRGGNGGLWVNGGEWARYNNQSFASDGFNGWWHDRPDRAYPAWMRNNQDCSRQWFAGNALRC